jgi:hypothetical protein
MSEENREFCKPAVMPRFIGMAVDLSDEAKSHLCVDDEEELNEYLPCRAYETDEISLVDGSRLIWLEGSPENVAHYVHRDMLVLNEA